jgi:hypothetical protein
MKNIGIILVGIGLAFGVFTLYLIMRQKADTVSPVPESKGVKVIYLTPGA